MKHNVSLVLCLGSEVHCIARARYLFMEEWRMELLHLMANINVTRFHIA